MMLAEEGSPAGVCASNGTRRSRVLLFVAYRISYTGGLATGEGEATETPVPSP